MDYLLEDSNIKLQIKKFKMWCDKIIFELTAKVEEIIVKARTAVARTPEAKENIQTAVYYYRKSKLKLSVLKDVQRLGLNDDIEDSKKKFKQAVKETKVYIRAAMKAFITAKEIPEDKQLGESSFFDDDFDMDYLFEDDEAGSDKGSKVGFGTKLANKNVVLKYTDGLRKLFMKFVNAIKDMTNNLAAKIRGKNLTPEQKKRVSDANKQISEANQKISQAKSVLNKGRNVSTAEDFAGYKETMKKTVQGLKESITKAREEIKAVYGEKKEAEEKPVEESSDWSFDF